MSGSLRLAFVIHAYTRTDFVPPTGERRAQATPHKTRRTGDQYAAQGGNPPPVVGTMSAIRPPPTEGAAIRLTAYQPQVMERPAATG